MKRNWIASIAKAWQVIFWLALAVVTLEAFILYRYPHLFTTWLFQILLLLSVIIITYLLLQYEPSDERLLRKLNLHYSGGITTVEGLDMAYIRSIPTFWAEDRFFICNADGEVLYKIQQQMGQSKFSVFDYTMNEIANFSFGAEGRIRSDFLTIEIRGWKDKIQISRLATSPGKRKRDGIPYRFRFLDDGGVIRVQDPNGQTYAESRPIATALGWLPANTDITVYQTGDTERILLLLGALTARWDPGIMKM